MLTWEKTGVFLSKRPSVNREFKKLQLLLQLKHHIKTELCARCFSVIPCHVVQNRQTALLVAWHKWFTDKRRKRMKDFSSCPQNLKYEKSMSSFGRLHPKIVPKSVLHIWHDYFSIIQHHFLNCLIMGRITFHTHSSPKYCSFVWLLLRNTRLFLMVLESWRKKYVTRICNFMQGTVVRQNQILVEINSV